LPPRDLSSGRITAHLRWAADGDGRLRRDRLLRIAFARDYHPDWVGHLEGRLLDEALHDLKQWIAEQEGEVSLATYWRKQKQSQQELWKAANLFGGGPEYEEDEDDEEEY